MKKEQHNTGKQIQKDLDALIIWKNELFYVKSNHGYIMKDLFSNIDTILVNELNYINKLADDLTRKAIHDSIDRLNKEFEEL
jgi:hypothetical protein